MLAAIYKLKQATLKAYQNKTAREQRNLFGYTIEDYAKENGIKLCTTNIDKNEGEFDL